MVFLTGEFSDIASNPTLRKTLGRLCQEGIIRRILDGVYEKPKYSDLLKEYLPTNPETAAYLSKQYWSIFLFFKKRYMLYNRWNSFFE